MRLLTPEEEQSLHRLAKQRRASTWRLLTLGIVLAVTVVVLAVFQLSTPE